MPELTLDQIFSGAAEERKGKHVQREADELAAILNHNLEPILKSQPIQREMNRVRWETVEADSAFFVGCLLQGIEALTNGNLLASGQAMDNALTHYLADLKARTGDSYAEIAAAALISNIALFLPPTKEAAVKKALEAR